MRSLVLKTTFATVFFGLILSFSASAQSTSMNINYKLYDSLIGKTFGGDTLLDPWVGGFNRPQFGKIDLNHDGQEDLVVFDEADQSITTYLYTGGLGQAKYKRNPAFEKYFPPCAGFFKLVDYNCDGQKDIFTQVSNIGITVYNNVTPTTQTEGVTFEKNTSFQDYYGNSVDYITTKAYNYRTNVFLTYGDVPVIADMDQDGDIDILSFSVLGPTVDYYRNMAIEDHGRCDTLDMFIQSQCWGRFQEGNSDNSIFLHQGDSTCDPKATRSGRHTGSTMLMLDIDGNGKNDLILGDMESDHLVALYNTGTKDQALITYYDTAFPRQDPVKMPLLIAPYYEDINNDTRKDLIAAPAAPDISKDHGQIWYYRNTRANTHPRFFFESNSFLTEDLFDMGTMAYPVIMDFNGDTLLDVLVGNYSRYDTLHHSGNLSLFVNVGSENYPVFELADSNYLEMDSLNLYGLAPAIGDMDSDGDNDLVVSSSSGYIYYFENQAASKYDTCKFVPTNHAVQTMSLPYRPTPFLYDLNKDSLLDFICGSADGMMHYFQNIGTAQNPIFDGSSNGHTDTLGGIVHQDLTGSGFTIPFFASLDSSGRMYNQDTSTVKDYLFLGTNTGNVYIYDFVSRDSANLLDSIYLNTTEVALYGGDITGNDTMDIVFGNKRGGLGFLFKNKGSLIPPKPIDTTGQDTQITTTVEPKIIENDLQVLLFPNPASQQIFIDMRGYSGPLLTKLTITDVTGKTMVEGDISSNYAPILEWNISQFPSGNYVLNLSAGDGTMISRQFVVQ